MSYFDSRYISFGILEFFISGQILLKFDPGNHFEVLVPNLNRL